MTDKIRVISADVDGAARRREKAKGRYYTQCDGRDDHEQISEAIKSVGRMMFAVEASVWERIFGKGK